jgi:vancomycin resistance protein VanW
MNQSEVLAQRRPLSLRHPILYFLSVKYHRLRRYGKWMLDKETYALHREQNAPLPYRVKKHHSVLIRKLGVSDMQLQYNKITNLRVAVGCLDGIVIKPNETFSFCKLVGLPTRERGFVEGLELSMGEARSGIGGGICQIANLINWLVLHSPLDIVQRSQHSFDPFPDEGRVLPFGSGAAIFYNYVDYQFKNNTEHTFQLRLWLTEKTLEGELLCNDTPSFSYHIFEREHQFLKIGDNFYRKNEIWRDTIRKRDGVLVDKKMLIKNFALVKYTPEVFDVVES